MSPPEVREVRPVPNDEEAAAIVASVELTWPRPLQVMSEPLGDRPPAWRFSGRWWARPIPVRRDRPWY